MSASSVAATPVRVAIIGTAGRKEDAAKMTSTVFARMASHAVHLQRHEWKLANHQVVLVSGGSAWADHVAVHLFLQAAADPEGEPYAGLQLFLPCSLTTSRVGQIQSIRATDNGCWQWQTNPGRLLNQLHDAFSKAIGRKSLNEIKHAELFGAQICLDGRGFHARNELIAKQAERMIAFTWGEDPRQPKDGGTLNTWQRCTLLREKKVHVPLKAIMTAPFHSCCVATPPDNQSSSAKIASSNAACTTSLRPRSFEPSAPDFASALPFGLSDTCEHSSKPHPSVLSSSDLKRKTDLQAASMITDSKPILIANTEAVALTPSDRVSKKSKLVHRQMFLVFRPSELPADVHHVR